VIRRMGLAQHSARMARARNWRGRERGHRPVDPLVRLPAAPLREKPMGPPPAQVHSRSGFPDLPPLARLRY